MIPDRDRRSRGMVPSRPAGSAPVRGERTPLVRWPWPSATGRFALPLAVVGIGVVLGLVIGFTIAVTIALAGLVALLALVAFVLLRRRRR